MSAPVKLLWFWFALFSGQAFGGRLLNLLEDPLPNHVQVHRGIFDDNGLYRMFVPESYSEKWFYYGDIMVPIVHSCRQLTICVEEYRSTTTFLEVITVCLDDINAIRRYTRLYEVRNNILTCQSLAKLQHVVKGSILLTLDLSPGASLHPYIVKKVNTSDHVIQYQVSPASIEGRKKSSRKKINYAILFTHDSSSSQDRGYPTSLVVFHAKSVVLNILTGYLFLKRFVPNQFYIYTVHPNEGTIKLVTPSIPSENLFVNPAMSPFSGTPQVTAVTINVTSVENPSSNVLVIYNVPKGDWLYSRHEVLIFSHVWRVACYVKDRMTDIPIFVSPEDVMVKHVETYNNLKDNKFFVVIKTVKRTPGGFITSDKLFQRVENEGMIGYIPHFTHKKLLYEMMLKEVYDTPAAPAGEARGALRYEMDTSGASLPPATPSTST
ncbi:hypothetical protein BBBOND_0109370 [Babesia bigemina]|uniref:Uncharacterized protein n=1 Tax=Babesia bigemina TaxID=5866 RepID=A0A061D6S4_BABBI|nr:hypothetical protein BBBOND_0109370 [Babesia bigemina]CDR94639.1 hypothetical protein BBBOND_0109370 [Babesia bigemina]|eukprot:XP_012766825.1 hypothetical protein BBBOND_0109370 [Babesia bigemina]